jgi:hypothetical protein
MYSVLAEAIPDEDGHSPLTPALHGDTCVVVLSKLFKQAQHLFAQYQSALKVTSVRIRGSAGIALLNIGSSKPPSSLRVHLDGQNWRVDKAIPNVLL